MHNSYLICIIIWNCQNSHAICDLGLSITKRLAAKEDDLQGLTASIPLPSMVYKSFEKKEGDDSVVSSTKNSFALFYRILYWVEHLKKKNLLILVLFSKLYIILLGCSCNTLPDYFFLINIYLLICNFVIIII